MTPYRMYKGKVQAGNGHRKTWTEPFEAS